MSTGSTPSVTPVTAPTLVVTVSTPAEALTVSTPAAAVPVSTLAAAVTVPTPELTAHQISAPSLLPTIDEVTEVANDIVGNSSYVLISDDEVDKDEGMDEVLEDHDNPGHNLDTRQAVKRRTVYGPTRVRSFGAQ